MAWNPYEALPDAATFQLTSSDIREGEKLPQPQVSGILGAGGEDRSPQLSWSGFPSQTRSFVLTLYDPDAPTVSGFWHWAVVNLPAGTTELATGAGNAGGSGLPSGSYQIPNDARLAQFLGAAPPEGHGRHRYIFCVSALDVERLDVPRDATPAFLMFNCFGHTLARAFLTCWYER